MGRQRGGNRCTGPYWERGRWRVKYYLDGHTTSSFYPSEIEAKAAMQVFAAELEQEQRTVGWALGEYKAHLVRQGKHVPNSIRSLMSRIRSLLPDDVTLHSLTQTKAQRLYDHLVKRPKRRGGGSISVDTHHICLRDSKAFLAWCVSQGWVRQNPFREVKPVGRKKAGKVQLTVTEARSLRAACLLERSPGATAVLSALLLGLRRGEIVSLEPRDIDDGVVWVWKGKSDRARRPVLCPPELQQLLSQHVPLRTGCSHVTATNWVGLETKRLCRVAGVTEVTPHGLRGTHASLARLGGATLEAVSAALGHAGTGVTERHYVDDGAAQAADVTRVFGLIQGGKK